MATLNESKIENLRSLWKWDVDFSYGESHIFARKERFPAPRGFYVVIVKGGEETTSTLAKDYLAARLLAGYPTSSEYVPDGNGGMIAVADYLETFIKAKL